MTPTQLKQLGSNSPASAISIAQSLTDGGVSLTAIMARSLGQNIPLGTNITKTAGISSGLPLSLIDYQQSADLLSSLQQNLDLNNMSPQRQKFIGRKVK
jgi:hypothetical protein